MDYRIVNPADWIPKIRPLLDKNWAETGFDFEFNPSIEFYDVLYKQGIGFAVAATDSSGNVVGYCTVCVTSHPYNPEIIMGSNDALFVDPEYRNSLIPARLIKHAEAEATRRGASRFMWHCRSGTDFSGMLLKHGYEPADQIVMRML